MKKRRPAFSLIEVMIAVLFITIGFFGYVALHSRILHSGQRLEEREVIRAGTDFYEAIEIARITLGSKNSISGQAYPVSTVVTNLHPISTQLEGRDTSWVLNYPPEFHSGLEETMETGPNMLSKPHEYTWDKR